MDLLQKLKFNRGAYRTDDSLDTYYKEILEEATAEFSADDISDEVLKTKYGQNAIIYCASLIIEKKDRATDSTLILMKNTLTNMTQGERC